MIHTRSKYRRLELLMKNDVPGQSEIRERMGPLVAEVFFDYCHRDSRKLLGIIRPLKTPREELWISPSDQFVEKVVLVPPSTDNDIKACTHQRILAIGQLAIEKHERELYEKFVNKYEQENEESRNMFEAERKRAVTLADERLESKYNNIIQCLQKEFKRKLQSAITESFKKCNKSMQKAVIRERVEVTQTMLKKFRDEIGYVVTTMYEGFDRSLRAQKENMIAEFNEILRREHGKIDAEIREMDRRKNESLQIQRTELEMQNFADITYILCLERMRSSSEKDSMHVCFEKQIESLKDLLKKANAVISLMKNENGSKFEKTSEDRSLRVKLIKIVGEFQKFINLALKAIPGQAEFLLSLESLLRAETDDKLKENNHSTAVQRSDQKLQQTDEIDVNSKLEILETVDSWGRKWIANKQPIADLSGVNCTEDQLMSSMLVKSEIAICSDKDYLRRGSRPSIASSNSCGSLPFCYLDKVMYVRSNYDKNENEVVDKTISGLAKDSRFIMELKKPQKNSACKPKIVENVKDSKC
ncbi:uncharacterized protein LOC105688533 [Athalia rosae]|uniref:uncharacterized protein LOC105688533 n=1 Tax=Athalia rosae TaxID=37344 RepID=UPI0020342F33|nr:uncharacterized protein LOC105688533 [Athalia rosae]